MTAAKKAGLDNYAERVYLTILAHADASGLVTQCSWSNIMDYASISKLDDVKIIVGELHHAGLLIQENSALRKTVFRLTGKFNNDILEARAFQAKNQERVNYLRNSRTNAYSKTKSGRTGITENDIFIENIEHIQAKEVDKPERWRFSLRMQGFGFIKNCIYIKWLHKEPEISGPSWRTRIKENGISEWIYLVEFEQEIYQRIYKAIKEEVEKNNTK